MGKASSPPHPHDYLMLARRTLYFLDHQHQYRDRLTKRPDGRPGSGVAAATALVRNEFIDGAAGFWIASAAMIGALAVGLGSGTLLGAELLTGTIAASLFASTSVVALGRYLQINKVLQEIRRDYDAHGEAFLRNRVEQLSRELTILPPPSSLEQFFDRASHLGPHLSLLGADSTPQQNFMRIAQRVATVASNHKLRQPNLGPTAVLDYAAQSVRLELTLRPKHLGALLRKQIGPKMVTQEADFEFEALSLAQYWFRLACTGRRQVYSFTHAYIELEKRVRGNSPTNG